MTVVQFRRPPKKPPERPGRQTSAAPPPKGRLSPGLRNGLLWLLVIAALTVVYFLKGGFASEADAAPRSATVTVAAAVRSSDIRVTDGDTFRVREERIRILNIDTPEMPGRARCADEGQRALAAKARLSELLASGAVSLERDGVDRYGRTLAVVRVNGVDVGEQLIAEGAAQRWMGRKATWC